MPQEDRDFILRQTKQLAEGLGKFLGKESVEEILKEDQATAEPKEKNPEEPSK